MSTKKQKLILSEGIGELCQTNPDGTVIKSIITIENYKSLKTLMKNLDIELMSKSKSFSYRQYCKLFESYLFKKKKCGGEICCQALTAEGVRCSRPASKFLTIDLTEVQALPTKIPLFIKRRMGAKKVEELKLIGFANTCCFYCWQHAAQYATEGATYASNFAYYTTHPEDLLKIFFENVTTKKILGLITYFVSVNNIRTPDEIIKYIYKTSGTMEGMLSSYYWGIFITVFMYDTIKPYIVRLLPGSEEQKEDVVEKMANSAAQALLISNE